MNFWRNKVVVVTGATAGLGLALARCVAGYGARVALVARDPDRLSETEELLRAGGTQCHSFPCDVTIEGQTLQLAERVVHTMGVADVLINNVGASTRRRVMDAEPEEYQRLFELNFMSALHCTRAFLPELLRQSGSIVNIGSLASKTAWPLIAPYSVGKAALGAYTHQLRLELSPRLHVMLVCPGPFLRPDNNQRYGSVDGLPLAARKPGAGARVPRIKPEWLAEKILRGCARRQAELVVPFRAKLLFAVAQLSPRLGDWLLRRMAGAPPAGPDPVDFFPAKMETSRSSSVDG